MNTFGIHTIAGAGSLAFLALVQSPRQGGMREQHVSGPLKMIEIAPVRHVIIVQIKNAVVLELKNGAERFLNARMLSGQTGFLPPMPAVATQTHCAAAAPPRHKGSPPLFQP